MTKKAPKGSWPARDAVSRRIVRASSAFDSAFLRQMLSSLAYDPSEIRSQRGVPMAEQQKIAWRHDFDKALEDAKRANRHVLVDFTAAPM
jgi:hypothetical protein